MITVLLDATTVPVVDTLVPLPDEERHHLRVRRTVADGREVRWTNAVGLHGTAHLEEQGKRTELRIVTAVQAERPAPLMLLVAAGDRDRWAWLVEKAAEVGVTDLLPIETERSRHVGSRLREQHLPKLHARGREACKQCGSVWAPTVHPVTELAAVTALLPPQASRWLADAQGASGAALGDVGAAAVAVGPEGGFTADERAALVAWGFAPVRLAPHILRFETAALAAAVLLTAHRLERTE